MINNLEQAMQGITPGSLEYGIGEILKSLAAESSHNAEIIEQDLSTEGMSLEDCAESLSDNARKNRMHYMDQATARRLVCDFYGIASNQLQQAPVATPAATPEIIDIMDFF